MLILFYYYLIEILNKYYKYIIYLKYHIKNVHALLPIDIVYILKLLIIKNISLKRR